MMKEDGTEKIAEIATEIETDTEIRIGRGTEIVEGKKIASATKIPTNLVRKIAQRTAIRANLMMLVRTV
jgi:hypothetical protein